MKLDTRKTQMMKDIMVQIAAQDIREGVFMCDNERVRMFMNGASRWAHYFYTELDTKQENDDE